MQVKAESVDRRLRLRLYGELDHHAARQLMKSIADELEYALPLEVVLDFSGVTFMDSSGIGLIIGRTKKLKYFNDSSVSVCNMSDRVDKLLKCAGIYTIVHKL